MIAELLADGVPEDEIVKQVMEALEVSEITARFMVGIEAGTNPGDFIAVEDESVLAESEDKPK